MSAKTEATLKGINDLKGEIGAWEMRLESIKNEIQALRGQKDALAKEIEDRKAVHNMEIDRKNAALREQNAKLADAQAELMKSRDALAAEKIELQKEKNVFERERTDALDAKANYTAMNEKLVECMSIIKRAAEKL